MVSELAHQLSRITRTYLREPASQQELSKLTSKYDAVPVALIELLAFANGEADSSFKSNGMIAFEAFIGASEIGNQFDFASDDVYDGLNEFITCDRIDKTSNWHDGLIPISFGYDAHYVCIDTKPGPNGIEGQILGLRPISGSISVIANCLTELLEKTLSIYREKKIDFSKHNCPELTLEDFPSVTSPENAG